MKPKPIKALAIVNKDKPVLKSFDIYSLGVKKEMRLNEGEMFVEVEITFKKYVR